MLNLSSKLSIILKRQPARQNRLKHLKALLTRQEKDNV